jgi:hypothetical protein
MGQEQRSVMRRRRIRHDVSFEDRLARAERQAREAAELLPPGLDRELLRNASACETAADIHAWISSPGTDPPLELIHGPARKAQPPHGG